LGQKKISDPSFFWKMLQVGILSVSGLSVLNSRVGNRHVEVDPFGEKNTLDSLNTLNWTMNG